MRSSRIPIAISICSGVYALLYGTICLQRLTAAEGPHRGILGAAILGGLAVGGLASGWAADRVSPQTAFRVLGFLDLFLGAWSLLSISLLQPSALLLLPPSLAMGAGFPLLSRVLVDDSTQPARRLSWIYGGTTAGAALGSLLAQAGGQALVICALVKILAYGLVRLASSGQLPSPPLPEVDSGKLDRGLAYLCGAALGGAAALFQLGWLRAVATALGSPPHLQAALIALSLAGLSLGSLLQGSLSRRHPPTFSGLAWALLALGGAGLASILALGGPSNSALVLIVLPAMICLGIARPIIGHLGEALGTLQACEAAGFLLGLLAFLSTPRVGMQITLQVACSITFCAAWLTLIKANPGPKLFVLCILSLPSVWLVPTWTPVGPGQRAPGFYKEGRCNTVTVTWQSSDSPVLSLDGRVAMSVNPPDLKRARMVGFLAWLFHKHPKRCLVLGMRGGFAVEAMACDARLESIECAEPEPALVEAMEFFKGFNGDVLAEPRVKVRLSDGRTLCRSGEKFDCLVDDAGLALPAAVSQCLNPDGVYCRCCSVFQDDFNLVLQNFVEAFPHAQAWQIDQSSLVLVGSASPLHFQLEQLTNTWRESPRFRDDMVAMDLYEARHILGHFLCDARLALPEPPRTTGQMDDLRARGGYLTEPGILPAQDNLNLAYAWQNLNDRRNLKLILASSSDGPAKAYLEARLQTRPLSQALQSYPKDYRLHRLAARRAMVNGKWTDAVEHLKACEEDWDSPASDSLPAHRSGWEYPVLLDMAQCLEKLENWQAASTVYERAAKYTDHSLPLRELGKCLVTLKEDGLAQHTLVRALQRNPSDYLAWTYMGQVRFKLQQYDKAVQALRQSLSLVPDDYDTLLTLALTYMKMGKPQLARRELGKVLGKRPQDGPANQILKSLPR